MFFDETEVVTVLPRHHRILQRVFPAIGDTITANVNDFDLAYLDELCFVGLLYCSGPDSLTFTRVNLQYKLTPPKTSPNGRLVPGKFTDILSPFQVVYINQAAVLLLTINYENLTDLGFYGITLDPNLKINRDNILKRKNYRFLINEQQIGSIQTGKATKEYEDYLIMNARNAEIAKKHAREQELIKLGLDY